MVLMLQKYEFSQKYIPLETIFIDKFSKKIGLNRQISLNSISYHNNKTKQYKVCSYKKKVCPEGQTHFIIYILYN